MNLELILIMILSASSAVLLLLLLFMIFVNLGAKDNLNKALDAVSRSDKRAEEIETAYKDMMTRPIQVMTSKEMLDGIGHALSEIIVSHLNTMMSGPMEVPIFPRGEDPKEPQQ